MNKEIIQAFQQKVLAIDLDGLPVKALGRTFEIPQDQKYIEIIHIPNDGDDRYIANEKMFQGIFRLVLHWPNNDEGTYPPTDIIDLLEPYFSKNNLLFFGSNRLEFYQRPKFLGAIEAGQEMIYPLSVAYRCFKPS